MTSYRTAVYWRVFEKILGEKKEQPISLEAVMNQRKLSVIFLLSADKHNRRCDSNKYWFLSLCPSMASESFRFFHSGNLQ